MASMVVDPDATRAATTVLVQKSAAAAGIDERKRDLNALER
jgi:hypothetical protein